ncbi:MAG TPA: V-type ATP synthase subunit D [Lentisphaeria bacterium]|nr:MAG: V-type ATP synthase subunit D [Lentisphaerae bacterium GWF2_49_21]HBC87429.1 V-type ATP synthase subunit D [Lentisphaeria bacterium]
MAKIKLTKSELKAQRDSLKQFSRYLPTLQLKKIQLQVEMRKCMQKLEENEQKQAGVHECMESWIILFSPDNTVEHLSSFIKVEEILTDSQNIAGVEVPVFKSVRFSVSEYDLFSEELWIDSAIDFIKNLFSLKAEHAVIRKQHELIGNELRITTQRVNLFEKVKIPECKENIRVIQIYMGDQQTAAVGRSKIAKRKMQETAA